MAAADDVANDNDNDNDNQNVNMAERICFNTHNLLCRKRAGLAVHRGIDAA